MYGAERWRNRARFAGPVAAVTSFLPVALMAIAAHVVVQPRWNEPAISTEKEPPVMATETGPSRQRKVMPPRPISMAARPALAPSSAWPIAKAERSIGPPSVTPNR